MIITTVIIIVSNYGAPTTQIPQKLCEVNVHCFKQLYGFSIVAEQMTTNFAA